MVSLVSFYLYDPDLGISFLFSDVDDTSFRCIFSLDRVGPVGVTSVHSELIV